MVFPPGPFAAPSQQDIPTLTAVSSEATPSGFSKPFAMPASRRQEAPIINKVFGSNPHGRMMLFVVLVTMCATLAVGLAAMAYFKTSPAATAAP